MKRNWPVQTLCVLGGAVGLSTLIILVSSVPLACGDKEHGSTLAGVFALVSLVLLVGGPSGLIAVGLREALTRPSVPTYAVVIVGVPTVIILSLWAIASAFTAASCGSSFLIMGG